MIVVDGGERRRDRLLHQLPRTVIAVHVHIVGVELPLAQQRLRRVLSVLVRK